MKIKMKFKKSLSVACSFAAFLTAANAAVLLDVTFDGLPNGTVSNGTTIANSGTGNDGVWDGGASPVAGGVVDTTSTDGYVNFASGGGFNFDLTSTSYTWEAWVDPSVLNITHGLIGQLKANTSDGSEYWFRVESDGDARGLLLDANGNQIAPTFETSTILATPGTHHLVFTADHTTDLLTLTIDGAAQALASGSSTNSFASINTTLGTTGDRMVVNGYNTTGANHWDGTADRYRITEIPEPSAIVLFSFLGLGMVLRRRRR